MTFDHRVCSDDYIRPYHTMAVNYDSLCMCDVFFCVTFVVLCDIFFWETWLLTTECAPMTTSGPITCCQLWLPVHVRYFFCDIFFLEKWHFFFGKRDFWPQSVLQRLHQALSHNGCQLWLPVHVWHFFFLCMCDYVRDQSHNGCQSRLPVYPWGKRKCRSRRFWAGLYLYRGSLA